mgnify:CR=1 FL=1
MKKLTCILLCLVLLQGCFQGVFADNADEAKTDTVFVSKYTNLLRALEIVDYDEDALAENITRGEFAYLAAKAACYSETKGKTVFADVPEDHIYAGYINTLYNMGIVRGEYGNFMPDSEITALEAASIYVKILGWSYNAESVGGFPYGYLSVANEIKLLEGQSGNVYKPLTKSEAVELTGAALLAKMLKITFDGDSYTDTLLYTAFEVKRKNGVVNGVDISRLSGENDIAPFYMEVDEEVFDAYYVENPYDFLGYNADVYYKDSPALDDKQIILIEKGKYNTEVSVDVQDVIEVSGGTIKYYDGDREKKSSLVSIVPVIYNGTASKNKFSFDMLKDKEGVIRLVDNNGDSVADVVFVDVYDNYIVSYVDRSKQIIYVEGGNKVPLELDVTENNPYTVIYDEFGAETSINALAVDSLISIYKSDDTAYQKYIRVYVSGTAVTGRVEKIREDKYVTIDETEYTLSDFISDEYKDVLVNIGENVTVKLDVSGRIAYARRDLINSKMQYGYLMNAAPDDDDPDKVVFKIFTMGGQFNTFEAGKKIKIDGKNYDSGKFTGNSGFAAVLNKASKVMNPAVNDDNCYYSIIRYQVDSKEKITAIDTVLNGKTGAQAVRGDFSGEYDCLRAQDSGEERYRSDTNTLGPKYAVKQDALAINYPSVSSEDRYNDSRYSVAPVSTSLVNNELSRVWLFSIDDSKVLYDFVGVEGSAAQYEELDHTFRVEVVDKVYKAVDEETGEVIYKVAVYSNGKRTEYKADPDLLSPNCGSLEKLKKGDLIRYKCDSNKYLRYFTILYSSSNDTSYSLTSFENYVYWRSFQAMRGYVYSKYDDAMYVYFTNEKVNVLSGVKEEDCMLLIPSLRETRYSLYEKTNNGKEACRSSSSAELIGYDTAGDKCSRVVVQLYYGEPYAIHIMNGEG